MEQCLTDRGKTHEKKNFGIQNWVRKKSFRHSFKFASSVFYDIAQDSSLGQCVPPSRAEISKKKKKRFVAQIRAWQAQIGTEMIFSILILSSFQSNLLVLFSIAIWEKIFDFLAWIQESLS